MLPIPPEVVDFRNAYRARNIGPRYRGLGHLALTSSVALAVITAALATLQAPGWPGLAVVAATFLFANLVEYLGHRFVMHVPRRGLGLVHRRHALEHHRFYTATAMAAETTRDFHMVLFPPVLLGAFLGGVAAPIGLLLAWLGPPDVARLFVATAVGYFLLYEWLHLLYHLPDDHPLCRLPGLAVLRRHHTLHHDPAVAQVACFNITFPMSDALFGTLGPRQR